MSKLDRRFRSVADAANVIADFEEKGIPPAAKPETRGVDEILRRKC